MPEGSHPLNARPWCADEGLMVEAAEGESLGEAGSPRASLPALGEALSRVTAQFTLEGALGIVVIA